MKKALLILALAVLVAACGEDSDNGNGKVKPEIPFGGEKFLGLEDDANGFYLPTLVGDAKTGELIYYNSDGVHIYDIANQSGSVIDQTSGVQTLYRGQLLANDIYVVWQHSPTDLYAYNKATGKLTKIPMDNPMRPGMCISQTDEGSVILVMSANQKMHACSILDIECYSSMPYTSVDGKSSLVFACKGDTFAVGARGNDGNYYLLVAKWELVGRTLTIKDETRVELKITGEPKQIVMNDKYIVFVNAFNDIYVVERAEIEASGTNAKVYILTNREDPDANYAQINDLYLEGDILVWSDNDSSIWLPFYADLTTRNPTTARYLVSQLSNSQDAELNPCTDGKYVLWMRWENQTEPSADTAPALWRGEIGAERQTK